ncbi:relaxase [Buttiauxella sp. B2]|uniref:LPD7 domain-containing protein n=1 Tax=Buttiauxella sp. B2 TaxID=2587812 RepID=UPI001120AC32|nr:LPD7 domain-containing protein [Buttiauxella sp. B2]TNV16124.1 relaxase [Buttiauxella sp. B2]
MTIIRVNGGNDGIAEYLENGRKAEREFTRDELDHRVILDGNLEITNTIIQSIENTGQERYLHITLSFQENDVSPETLKSITDEYKSLLMNAYQSDEYCFYAEAHLPKIKNIPNNATGELVERKPHIHIVIPETNLVTGNKLLPTGKVTVTERYLDAIQEHINYKYKLKSPKDAARVSDDNYANVLSRTKGDMFRERNSDLKKEIYNGLTTNDITSFSDFGHYLEQFGDVKLKNSGKENSYFSVKFDGDSKFTNLKNPLFSRQYIENRDLQLVKPTEKQVLSLVTDWKEKVSHEVKHIFPKSSVVRNTYNALNAEDKKNHLKERIETYDRENKLSGTRGRSIRDQRGAESSTRPSKARRANRLSYMPQCTLVYGIRGSSRQPGEQHQRPANREASNRVLQNDEHRNLGESRTESLYVDQAMRWNDAGEQPEFTRGIKTIQESSVLHDEYWQHLNEKAQTDEIHTMREIRDNIDPLRLLAGLQRQYQANPYDYKISQAKDGSPRFKVGNRNMNASDFLTKHFNLSWKDSKDFLLKTYAAQQANTPFEKPVIRKALTKNEANERFYSLKETQKELKNIIKEQRSSLYNEIKELRSQIYQVKGTEREVARGVIIYHKITGLEALSEIDSKGREFLNDYHNIWNEDKDPMKALQKLREFINQDEDESSVEAAETTLSIKDRVSSQQRIQELQRTRLKDLVMQKSPEKLVFLNPESEKPVFIDKGVRVIASQDASNEEIALILEYSKEKFGGVLKLNGNDEFKTQCALVAAEKGMNIILKPDEFNQLMKQHKADLVANQIQQDTQEQTAPEQSIESVLDKPQQTVQAETEQAQTVVQDNTLAPVNELDNLTSKAREVIEPVSPVETIQQEAVAIEHDFSVIDKIKSDSYNKELLLSAEDKVFGYVKDVIDEYEVEYEVMGYTKGDSEDVFTFATFDNEIDAKSFSEMLNDLGLEKMVEIIDSRQNAQEAETPVDQVKTLLADNGLRRIAMSDEQKEREFNASPDMANEVKAQINSEIIESRTGVFIEPAALVQDVIEARNATQPVKGAELKSLVSEYAEKAESENLEFFVNDVTEEIESAGMTFDEAGQHLEKELNVMRSVKQDMQQDDNEQTM